MVLTKEYVQEKIKALENEWQQHVNNVQRVEGALQTWRFSLAEIMNAEVAAKQTEDAAAAKEAVNAVTQP